MFHATSVTPSFARFAKVVGSPGCSLRASL